MNSGYVLNAGRILTIPVVDCSLWLSVFFENAQEASKKPSSEYLANEFCELLGNYSQVRKIAFPYLASNVVRLGPFKGISYHDLIRTVAGEVLGRVYTLCPSNGDFGGSIATIAQGIQRTCDGTMPTEIMKALDYGIHFNEYDLVTELIHEDEAHQRDISRASGSVTPQGVLKQDNVGVGNGLPIVPFQPDAGFWQRHREHWENASSEPNNGVTAPSKAENSGTPSRDGKLSERPGTFDEQANAIIKDGLTSEIGLKEIRKKLGNAVSEGAILKSLPCVDFMRHQQEQGKTQAEVAKVLGCCRSRISKIGRENGIVFRANEKNFAKSH